MAEAALADAPAEPAIVIDDRPGLVLRMEMLASSAAIDGQGAACRRELLGACECCAGRIGAEAQPVHASTCRGGSSTGARLRSAKPTLQRRPSTREPTSTGTGPLGLGAIGKEGRSESTAPTRRPNPSNRSANANKR